MNLATLSRGVVRCTIVANRPLPTEAYPVLAELARAVEEADRAITELLLAEEP